MRYVLRVLKPSSRTTVSFFAAVRRHRAMTSSRVRHARECRKPTDGAPAPARARPHACLHVQTLVMGTPCTSSRDSRGRATCTRGTCKAAHSTAAPQNRASGSRARQCKRARSKTSVCTCVLTAFPRPAPLRMRRCTTFVRGSMTRTPWRGEAARGARARCGESPAHTRSPHPGTRRAPHVGELAPHASSRAQHMGAWGVAMPDGKSRGRGSCANPMLAWSQVVNPR